MLIDYKYLNQRRKRKLKYKKTVAPYIIVRRKPPETHSGGMIILPDTQGYDNRECEVLAIHDGHTFFDRDGNKVTQPCSVNVGDRILTLSFDGDKFDPEDQYIEKMDENLILCVVEPGALVAPPQRR